MSKTYTDKEIKEMEKQVETLLSKIDKVFADAKPTMQIVLSTLEHCVAFSVSQASNPFEIFDEFATHTRKHVENYINLNKESKN